ncbi:MAG: TolC family protein [Deltaproteobacteria bacterium]|nr:TolC family protein [Deltaproteobacteria bacterium]
MIIRKICRVWLTICLVLFREAAANTLSLESFLTEVKQSNPTLQSVQFQAEALRHRVGPSQAWDDPFFAIGPDQIPLDGSGGSMLRFQLSQTIPFPGKSGAKGVAAEQRFSAAQAGAETATREITVLATQAFYRAFFNQRSIELNKNLKSLLSGAVESTRARYQTGDASHHDWLLARVELSVLEVERLRLDREGHTLRALLNELRNRPPELPIKIAPVVFGDLVNEAPPDLNAQPELKALEASVSLSEAERRYARLSYFPDFVLQGMAMTPTAMDGMGGQKSSWGVMVGVSLPLYFWGKQTELSAAAENSRSAALAEKRGLENRLNSEIIDAQEQLKTARDVITLYKTEVLPSTEIALENAKVGYAAKRLPLTQFIDTLKVKRTQELEFLAAQIDGRLAQTRIRELLSSPPTLRLAPSRPTLFGGMAAPSMVRMGSSDTVGMGRGMSGPTRKSKSGAPTPPSGEGMPEMGGGM